MEILEIEGKQSWTGYPVVNYVGEDRFFWATDYPHFDHPGNYMQELEELVAPLSETARNNLLGDSVANVYGI